MSDITTSNSSFVQNTLNPMTTSTPMGSLLAASNNISNPASTDSSSSDLLRITGMATGLNVDDMVSKMMLPYQANIDKVQQDEQKVQWRQQMYSSIINDVKSFQDTYFNVGSPDTNITSPQFFNVISATSSSDAVKAAADSSAAQGSYSVIINNLATAAQISGGSLNSEIKCSQDLSGWQNGSIAFQSSDGTQAQISLNNFTYDSSEDALTNMSNLSAAINSQLSQTSLSGKVSSSVVIDNNTGNALIKLNNSSSNSVQITSSDISDVTASGVSNITSISSSTTLSELNYSGAGSLNLNYSGGSASISVSSSETLQQLASDIGSQTGGKVSARVDELSGRFILEAAGTGSQNTLSITNNAGDPLLASLRLTNLSAQGKDAVVGITEPDGSSQTITEVSNSFSFNGLSLTLSGQAGSTAVVNVGANVDAVFNKFKGFMDKYNSLVTEISGKVNEKVSFGYAPLTDAQKKQMSSADIQNWNVQAQVGLLHDDDSLTNMLGELKNSFYDAIQGISNNFGTSSLGIDFSTDFSKDGTLVFTDGTGDAFKKTLQSNADSISKLFTQSGAAGATGTDKYNSEGIFQRINDTLVKYTDMAGVNNSTNCILGNMAYKQDSYSVSDAGSGTFLDQIFYYNNQINQLRSDYSDKKDQYYKQFSDLEVAMNQLNSQQSELSQLTGGQ